MRISESFVNIKSISKVNKVKFFGLISGFFFSNESF